jgi:uncharacterized protein (TIGR00369 family)
VAHEAAARARAPDASEAFAITLDRCTATQVDGHLSVGVPESDPSFQALRSAAVFALAEALTGAGATTAGQATRTLDTTVHFVAPAGSGALRGAARALSSTPASQLWQTDIFDEQDALVAVVTLARVMVAGVPAVQPIAAPGTPALVPVDTGTIPEQRLRQIVNAGSQVFGKSGYSATSMRDVAAAAGMPIATMYQYVTGKEKLLLLIFETYMAEISTALDRANDPAKTPRERLHDCIEATLTLYDAYRRQIRLIYQEGRSLSPENRERVRKLARSTHKVWEGILQDGIESGEFSCRDPAVTASFIPMLCSIWVVRYSSVKGNSLNKVRESILELVEGGLRVGSSPKRSKAPRS